MKLVNINKGLTLVEVMVAASIILFVIVSMITALNLYIKAAYGNANSVEAAYLTEEGVEAVKILRDNSWASNIATLSNDTIYYLAWNGTTWKATTTNTYIDTIFERSFILSSASRNANGDIDSSGTLDPGTKQLLVSVSWNDHGATTTKGVLTYITNYHND